MGCPCAEQSRGRTVLSRWAVGTQGTQSSSLSYHSRYGWGGRRGREREGGEMEGVEREGKGDREAGVGGGRNTVSMGTS